MKQKLLFALSLIMYALTIVAIYKVKIYSEADVSTINKNIIINFEVTAKSCIVYDNRNNKILYEKNAHNIMYPASITKILTAISCLQHYPLDDYVYVTNDIANQDGSKIYLKVGDYISIEDLLYGLMLSSGNDCAQALALHYSGKIEDFITLMNDTAKIAGAKSSLFQNPSGLDEINENKTTAYDMAMITSYALKNDIFCKIFKTKYHNIKLDDRTLCLRHKHRLIHYHPLINGGKTGYTKKAGRTLISYFKTDDSEIIVVTLDAYNDWTLHENFAKVFLKEQNELYENTIVKNILNNIWNKQPFSKRLRGEIND